MHKLLLTFLGFVIFSLNTYSQDKIEIKTFEEKTHYDSLETNTFYFIDETLFQSIQQSNEKEFKLVYMWEIWCKSCVKSYPLVLKLMNDYKSIDAFLIINDSREKYLKRVVKFFEKKVIPMCRFSSSKTNNEVTMLTTINLLKRFSRNITITGYLYSCYSIKITLRFILLMQLWTYTIVLTP